MKSNKQKWFWILDLALFTGFLMAFFFDLTGLSLHQWLGVAVGGVAVLHLVLHWNWVKSLTCRLFEKNVGRSGMYYVLDAILFAGLFLITLTGLVISSWLSLALADYLFWRNLHVTVSTVSLIITLVKLGLHWRWVVKTAQKIFKSPERLQPVFQRFPLRPGFAVQPIRNEETVDRRHFLAMMGVVGLGSLVAVSNVLIKPTVQAANLTAEEIAALEQASVQQATATVQATQEATATGQVAAVEPTQVAPTAFPTSAPTAVPQQVAACVVRCQNGCAFPGRCRRYTDQNANGYCDLGECM
jgi:hypothetical protein